MLNQRHLIRSLYFVPRNWKIKPIV